MSPRKKAGTWAVVDGAVAGANIAYTFQTWGSTLQPILNATVAGALLAACILQVIDYVRSTTP